MKITINTKILQKHRLSLGEFLLMLSGYYDIDLQECYEGILKKSLAEKNIRKDIGIILSNNSKNLVARIFMESNEKVLKSGIDFESLAGKLMEIYPKGYKPGSTHLWRSDIETIAQKLRVLVALHGFEFTEEEAVKAVSDYVSQFKQPYKEMLLLRSFILTTAKSKSDNTSEVSSLFMTYIENGR